MSFLDPNHLIDMKLQKTLQTSLQETLCSEDFHLPPSPGITRAYVKSMKVSVSIIFFIGFFFSV